MRESKRRGGEVHITGVAAERGWGLCFGAGKRQGKEIGCLGWKKACLFPGQSGDCGQARWKCFAIRMQGQSSKS